MVDFIWLRMYSVFRMCELTGFKEVSQERDYTTIIAVARKIPKNVLQEDPKLLMWCAGAYPIWGGG